MSTYIKGYLYKEAFPLAPSSVTAAKSINSLTKNTEGTERRGGGWNPMDWNMTEGHRKVLDTVGPGGLALILGGLAAGVPYAAKWGLKRMLPDRGSKKLQMPEWLGGERIPVSRQDVDEIPGWWLAAPMGLTTALLTAANYGRTLRDPEARGFIGPGNVGTLHTRRT